MGTAARKHAIPEAPKPSRRRRQLVTRMLACLIALAGCGLGWALWAWCIAAAPPVVSLADVDRALADAIAAARRTVWWNPYSSRAWGRLGQLLWAHRYRAEANLCFAQAEQLDPRDPRWPYLRGLGLQRENPEAALPCLQRAVALCGSVPDAPELCLAEACLHQGQLDSAEQHFRQILRHDPDNPRAHLGLGRLAHVRGNLPGSLEHLKRSVRSPRTQKASAALLAQVYYQLGDPVAAARERTRAADLPDDPPWPDPFVEETQALTVGKQFRLARLQALHHQGRAAEVRTFAAKLEDDYPDVYWLVEGRQLLDKEAWAAAEQALRIAIQLAPDSVEAHFDLGIALLRQNRYRAAAESFRKVIELEPSYGPAYQRLGDCRRMQGLPTEAMEALQTAVRYMPQNAAAHRELGSLLLQEGKAAQALVHLRQALLLQPGDAKVQELLDQCARSGSSPKR